MTGERSREREELGSYLMSYVIFSVCSLFIQNKYTNTYIFGPEKYQAPVFEDWRRWKGKEREREKYMKNIRGA